MNNRIGLAVAGVIAAIAIILVVIQSGNLSQAQGTINSIQSTATGQQAAFVSQGTAAVATLSAASTQAADSASAAATSQANAAATAQANALSDAANKAATEQAEALAAAANAASTMQAQALAAASRAAATAEAKALADAANKAATQQAQAEATLEAQATSTLGAAMNAAATQQARAEATLEAQATATLGAVVNAMGTAQADAVNAAQSAAAVEQEKALATFEAQATATLRAAVAEASTAIAQVQSGAQATQTALEGQITDLQGQVATAQASQPNGQATTVSPTAEATTAASVPSDWKRYVGKGVAIQLPNTYVGSELGSDPEALGKMLRSLGPDFAAAATLFEQQPEILSFIAVDVGGKTGSPASVIVLSVPMPAKFSLNTLLDATISQLPRGSKVKEKGVVQVGEYEAGRMILETQVGGIVSTQLQYYIIQNDKLYLVGFTGISSNFEEQLPAFEQSMKTFEILSKPGI